MTAQYRPKGSSVLWCPGQQFPDVPCQLVMGTHWAYSASLETLSEGSFLILMCQLCMSHMGRGMGLWEMKPCSRDCTRRDVSRFVHPHVQSV